MTTESTIIQETPILENKDTLNALIEENARSLANIQEQLSKSKSTVNVPLSNVEGISPVPVSPSSSMSTGLSSPNMLELTDSLVKDTVSTVSTNPLLTNTVEKDSSIEQSSSLINDIKPVSIESLADEKLDGISESANKIKLAAQVTAEQAGDLLKRNGITIERTEQASRRLDALVNRAETFIRSFDNPGRIVMYTAFGITTLYSLYNVIRYGQLPLIGVFRGMMAGTAANQGSNQSSNTSHVININYPEKVSNLSNSVPLSTGNGELTSLVNTLFSTPYFSMALVGLVWVLRRGK
jgi:hypothetical protein